LHLLGQINQSFEVHLLLYSAICLERNRGTCDRPITANQSGGNPTIFVVLTYVACYLLRILTWRVRND